MFLFAMLLVLGSVPSELTGVWELKKEDGKSEARKEVLYFYKNGKLWIDGVIAQRGSYKHENGKLTTEMTFAGQKQSLARACHLEGPHLRLESKNGFDHYEKLDRSLPEWREGTWQHIEVGYFKIDVPPDWQVHKEEPDAHGSQRLVLQDTKRLNALTLLRIPGRGKEVDLENALKGVMAPMLEGLQIQQATINQNQGTFYNRVGIRLETTQKVADGKTIGVYTFGQKLEADNYLVALFSFEAGTQGELEKAMSSLKTPQDPDLKKAQAKLAAELAEKEKAKAADTHNHSGHKH